MPERIYNWISAAAAAKNEHDRAELLISLDQKLMFVSDQRDLRAS